MGFTLNNITHARPDPGRRHRHRRRGRGAREHLPAHGGVRAGRAWEAASVGDAGDRPGGAGDDAVAGRSSSSRSRSWAGRSGGSSTASASWSAFAILMSMFVSFTLTPMLCARFLQPLEASGKGTSATGDASQAASVLAGWRRRGGYGGILALVAAAPVGRRRRHDPHRSSARRSLFVHRRARTSCRRTTRASSRSPITLPEGYTLERADEVLRRASRRGCSKLRGVTHTFTDDRRHDRPRRPRARAT